MSDEANSASIVARSIADQDEMIHTLSWVAIREALINAADQIDDLEHRCAALCGIPDPAAQVERWKAYATWLRRKSKSSAKIAALLALSPAEIATLAAEWTTDE